MDCVCCREGLALDYLKQPAWSEVREASFGMGVLTVENSTHALWQWHRNMDKVTEVRIFSPNCAAASTGLGMQID